MRIITKRRAAAVACAGAVALTVSLLGQVPASAATSAAATQNTASAATTVTHTFTLVNGDIATAQVDAKGAFSGVKVTDSAGADILFSVFTTPTGTYVYPEGAQALIDSGKVDRDLFNLTKLLSNGDDDDSTDAVPTIVSYPSATVSRQNLVKLPTGTTVTRPLSALNGAGLTVDKTSTKALWSQVTKTAGAKLWLNEKVTATDDSALPPSAEATTGLAAARAAGYIGTGVKVAVLDSGVDAGHPDLQGRIIDSSNELGTGGVSTTDNNGHGTHVASLVAGTGAASGGEYVGEAPGSSLLIGQVLDDTGADTLDAVGDDVSVVAGIQWAVEEGAQVITLSLGTEKDDCVGPDVDAIKAYADKAVFVVAAGNAGTPGSVATPGCSPYALTVGATDSAKNTADFSSRGPVYDDTKIALQGTQSKPDISAPGVDVVGARAGGRGDQAYITMSGTSMATPIVAGAAADLIQEHPDATPQQIKQLLTSSADDTSASVLEQGAGPLDLGTAITQTLIGEPNTSLGSWAYPQQNAASSAALTVSNLGAATSATFSLEDLKGADGSALPSGVVALAPTAAQTAAQSKLSTAQTKLAAAQKALTTAQSKLTTAQKNLTAAQKALTTAKSTLAAAQKTLSAAKTSSAKTKAKAAVTKAQKAVTAANTTVTTDKAAVTSAQKAVTTATSTVATDKAAVTAATAAVAAAKKTSIAAGGSIDVGLTVNPGVSFPAAAHGTLTGRLVGVAGTQRVVIPFSLYVEPPTANVTVKGLDRDGNAAAGGAFWDMLDATRSQAWSYSWTDASGNPVDASTVRVPLGTYTFASMIPTQDDPSGHGYTKSVSLLVQSQVAITKDTTITFDASAAQPITWKTDKATQPQGLSLGYSFALPGSPVSHVMPIPSYVTDIYGLATGPADSRLTSIASARLTAPNATMTLDGAPFDYWYVGGAEPLGTTGSASLVKIPRSDADALSASSTVDYSGKIVLVTGARDSDPISVWSNTLGKLHATAVIAAFDTAVGRRPYSPAGGIASFTVVGAAATALEGAADGATIAWNGYQRDSSPYIYNLVRTTAGTVGTGAQTVHDSELSERATSWHTQNDSRVEYSDEMFRLGTMPGAVYAGGTTLPVWAPVTRDEFYTPGVKWTSSAMPLVTVQAGGASVDGPRTPSAGTTSTSWFGGPIEIFDQSDGTPLVSRSTNKLKIVMPTFSDSSGHDATPAYNGSPRNADQYGTAILIAGKQQNRDGNGAYTMPDASTPVTIESHWQRAAESANTDTPLNWTIGTAQDTLWTFKSSSADQGAQDLPVPKITLPTLDSRNTVPSGADTPFVLSKLSDAAAPAPLLKVKVRYAVGNAATLTDANSLTWTDLPITAESDGTWSGSVPAQAAGSYVHFDITMVTDLGATMEQTLVRAYQAR
jgi:subtilisin family serine protease